MEHLDFVIWMLGYPLVVTVNRAIRTKWIGIEELNNQEKTMETILHLIIWSGVGSKLF